MILRPLAEGDEAELRRIHATPEVVRWWDVPPEGWHDSLLIGLLAGEP